LSLEFRFRRGIIWDVALAITRRRALAALGPLIGGGVAMRWADGPAAADQGHAAAGHAHHTAAGADGQGHATMVHAGFRAGRSVDHAFNGFDPWTILRDFDWGKTTRLASGRTLREWTLIAGDREIEVAPGVRFQAWTYNDRVPGPTIRAREGELLRIHLVNASDHPHTIHFHGVHRSIMDGVPGIGAGAIGPGRRTTYEFEAKPFGLHMYHCHVAPLAEHIAKGLHGAFVIDPADGRPDADEMVMVMNGFDTNFDRSNEVYAANTIPFAYMERPIQVERGRLVRLYLANALEYDLVNSFHLHGNFFQYFPTGTSLAPSELTDTVMQCQGQRGIVEMTFEQSGRYMFHAHQSEFTELGWVGFFEVA
jgi:FtsP/CotA-like multicopper oxidase with cupredoxin domain